MGRRLAKKGTSKELDDAELKAHLKLFMLPDDLALFIRSREEHHR